jgi:(p)ppGpp synthase/HD superfamily hydrolase
MSYTLGTIQEERLFRLEVQRAEGVGSKKRFIRAVDTRFGGPERDAILRAFQFATELEYTHVGLSSEAYLAHPLRVAEMAIGLCDSPSVDTVIIALLHNALEMGGVDDVRLDLEFGERVARAIQILTVDRAQQWDLVYKQGYYDAINACGVGARIVKALDKFDNIFLLCLNSDAAIREAYLKEIDTHVIPMAEEVLPRVAVYFKRVSKNAQEIGYQPSSKS